MDFRENVFDFTGKKGALSRMSIGMLKVKEGLICTLYLEHLMTSYGNERMISIPVSPTVILLTDSTSQHLKMHL